MKKIFSLLLCATFALCGFAQNYVQLKDTLWGCRYFAFDNSTGQPYSTGSKTGRSSFTWPSRDNIEVRYYVRIPAGHVRADMLYTPAYGRALNLNVVVTKTDNKQVVYDSQINLPYQLTNKETSLELIPDMVFPADTWYQITLSCPGNVRGIRNISKILFEHDATERVVPPTVFMAPSAHNNSWHSTDPDAPNENGYDWIYGEFLYPEEYAFPNRYLMCLGGSGYYSGIQVVGTELRNTALFSAWDNGDTDNNPNLPAYLRSGGIDNNTDVAINRFGNEGTGIQSMLSNAHWKRGHWVQWLMNARPETTTVTLKDKDGNDSVISYANTILTAWYKMEDDPEWHYISTLRQSGTTHVFGNAGEYSFLECFTDGGGDNYVKCYMRNRFYRSVGSGKWYNRNYMSPGHYNYNDGARECRYDYGHGATKEYENCFFIEQGGFGQVNDSSMYIPLATNTECVDTINLDDKINRINLAFRNNYYKQITADIDQMLAADNAAGQLTALAKDYIDHAGQPGYFSKQDVALIQQAYNDGNPADINQLANAIKETAQNYNTIRYANVTGKNFVGSQRAYLLQPSDGTGFLYAELQDGKPVIKVGDKERDDKCANWIILRSDKYNTITVYNLGLGLFLNFDDPNLLSAQSQNLEAFNRYGRGFYIGKNTSNVITAANDGTISVTNNYRDSHSQFLLLDNLSYTPDLQTVLPIIEASEKPGKFEEYKALVPQILATPQGVMGSWVDPDELNSLRDLYDDGNITIDNADRLFSLIDNAKTLSLATNETGVFTITSTDESCAETPYFTIDADRNVYHRSATGKADQIWVASPRNGGHALSSQGRALCSLSESTNSNVTTEENGATPFYFMPQGGGAYNITNIQYGRTLLSNSTDPIKTAATTNGVANTWYLTPAKQVKVSLNSVGITTLFLDFDVLIPEGIQAYRIDTLTNYGPTFTLLEDTITARTPVIISGTPYGTPEFSVLQSQTLPTQKYVVKGTLLKKTGLKSRTYYTVSLKQGKPVLALTMGTSVNANQCYVLKEDMDELGLTETQYDIDFDNITAVDDITAAKTDKPTKAYDLQGRRIDPASKGIIIKDHKTILNK